MIISASVVRKKLRLVMDERLYAFCPACKILYLKIAVDQEVPVFVGFQLVVDVATSALPAACEHGRSFREHTRLKDLNIAPARQIPIRIIKVEP